MIFIYFQFSLMAPQRSAYERVLLLLLCVRFFFGMMMDGWLDGLIIGGAKLPFSVIACVVLRIDHVSHHLAFRLILKLALQ